MKKILFILIILFSIVCITGCGVKKENTIIEKDEEVLTEDTTHNILVTYFSKSGENYGVGSVDIGNTALMASYISDYLECDSFEIVPVKKYSDNYRTATEEAKKEQNENARPEIKDEVK